MAQPPLSKAIRGIEAKLGVVLLERTTRSVALTAAGAVLLEEARAALEAVAAAGHRAARAGGWSWRSRPTATAGSSQPSSPPTNAAGRRAGPGRGDRLGQAGGDAAR
jgi:DNA-binding transcriptional LysR family regulator